MRLSSARDLKNQITADPRWRTARDENGVRMAIGIALGDHPDAYRIAVRAEDPGSVDQELLEQITSEAENEIDLQYTGPLEILPVHDPVPVGDWRSARRSRTTAIPRGRLDSSRTVPPTGRWAWSRTITSSPYRTRGGTTMTSCIPLRPIMAPARTTSWRLSRR